VGEVLRMKKVVRAILAKTKVGRYHRTTIPEEVRKILNIKEGDEVVWIQEGDKIYIEKAKQEITQ